MHLASGALVVSDMDEFGVAALHKEELALAFSAWSMARPLSTRCAVEQELAGDTIVAWLACTGTVGANTAMVLAPDPPGGAEHRGDDKGSMGFSPDSVGLAQAGKYDKAGGVGD